MRTKSSSDMLWNITVIIFIGIGMTLGYIFNDIVLPKSILSSIHNKSLYYSITIFYLFILLIGISFSIDYFYIEKEIFFGRIFPSKILINIILSYFIGFIGISLFIKQTFIVTIINIFIGYILCKFTFNILEFIKRW